MIATKFVMLLLIGVLCANVGARKLEEDTKLSISHPKTSTKGVGAELSVSGNTYVSVTDYTGTSAAGSPSGPAATGYGSQNVSTGGYVNADGPDADIATSSSAGSTSTAGAATSPDGAIGTANSTGGGSSSSSGSTSSGGSPEEDAPPV